MPQGLLVQSKRYVKYFIISFVTLFCLYNLIDQIFIRGRLIESYQGVVVQAWDNTDIPGPSKGKPNIYQASVELNNGAFVNIVCQYSCTIGQRVKVDKFQPLVGWTVNYYSGI